MCIKDSWNKNYVVERSTGSNVEWRNKHEIIYDNNFIKKVGVDIPLIIKYIKNSYVGKENWGLNLKKRIGKWHLEYYWWKIGSW